MTTPLFDIGDAFDTKVPIGDQQLPIHIRRFSRADMDAFEKKWDALVNPPRGTGELTAEEKAQRETEQLAFFESAIRDAITLDEGLVRNRGKWVTDGAGLIETFFSRKDVLSAFLMAIYTQNKLTGVIRKNSNSPRASEPGSEPSIPARGGDRPGPTAAPAESSSTATSAGATDVSNETDADAPDSSGEPRKVH